MKRILWMILLLVFVLALAACGGDEPEATVAVPTAVEEAAQQEEPAVVEEAAAPEATEETAVVVEPTQEPAPVEEEEIAFADLELSGLADLTSYRYDMVLSIIGTDAAGVETNQNMHMVLAVSTDPPATSMLMTADGSDEMAEMGTMEFVQIEDTSYIVMAELGCMALPAGEDSGMSTEELTENFTPEAITENLDDATFVGKETIDGIDVLHYTYDETSMKGEDAVGVESAEGHLYIAKDGGYLVRSIIDVVGSSTFMTGLEGESFESATTHIEMNLTDVNEAVEILPPAACDGQDAAAASDWPMIEDASEVVSFAGVVSYSTALSGEEAIDFYNTAMSDLGYTMDESGSFISDGTGFLSYVNESGEAVTITIAEDAESGLTAVTILSEE